MRTKSTATSVRREDQGACALSVSTVAGNFLGSAHENGPVDRARLEAVAGLIGGSIWETDREHRYVYVSANVDVVTGVPAVAYLGKTRHDMLHSPLRSGDGKTYHDQMRLRAPFGPVDFMHYVDGRPFVVRTSGVPLFDRDGAFSGYLGLSFAVSCDPANAAVNRRAEQRRRVVRAAEIACASTTDVISCVVVDVSASGARIRIPPDVALPRQFQLRVPSLSLDRTCTVRWHRIDAIGVEFER